VITIDVLPDDVLLEIFDFCVDADQDPLVLFHPASTKKGTEMWQSLVHVCRRWRSVVFGSPRRLNLQLICTSKTTARDTLDVWPALPLLIQDNPYLTVSKEGLNNIITVLECSDHVCQIHLVLPASRWEKVLGAMQIPFPELTGLWLNSYGLYEESVTVLPDSFLGGSAPRLQHLQLERISFPGLTKLLLSATHLVRLHLEDIPHSGYISPEAIVTVLSTLTTLGHLSITFASPQSKPQSRPDQASRRLPPTTRSVLPVLTWLKFEGANEYLEVVVACLDAPRLDYAHITFFDQILHDTSQFTQFISRTPKLTAFENAHVDLMPDRVCVKLSSQIFGHVQLDMRTPERYMDLDGYLSSLERVCTSCLPPLPTLEDLYLDDVETKGFQRFPLQINTDYTLWMELLHPFAAVRNLYLSEIFVPCIAPALQDLVGGRTTEVLPTLQNIFLEGTKVYGFSLKEIGRFVAARQVTGHPISISRRESQGKVPRKRPLSSVPLL
jgi:hypothetical protein